MKRFLSGVFLAPIRAYQRFISPALPRRCKYDPTCSAYAVDAVRELGVLRGLVLAGWRLLRCNPFSHGGYDPVEDQTLFKRHRGEAASVILAAREHPAAADRRRRLGHHVLPRQRRPQLGRRDHRRSPVTVRIPILPLSLRGSARCGACSSSRRRSRRLQEKYKDDRQRLQREMMELYKKESVNPFASCLPFILQIPFFIAIYQLLRGSTFQADVMASPPPGFLFVKSVIAAPQGAELIVLIVLFVTTTAASVLLTTATSPTASPAQRYLMLLFPLIIVPFIINAPAGLAVYWITTNLFSLGQQWIVNRVMPAPAPATAEEIKETKAPPPPPRKKKRKRR